MAGEADLALVADDVTVSPVPRSELTFADPSLQLL
jgi:hypothetical protein